MHVGAADFRVSRRICRDECFLQKPRTLSSALATPSTPKIHPERAASLTAHNFHALTAELPHLPPAPLRIIINSPAGFCYKIYSTVVACYKSSGCNGLL